MHLVCHPEDIVQLKYNLICFPAEKHHGYGYVKPFKKDLS